MLQKVTWERNANERRYILLIWPLKRTHTFNQLEMPISLKLFPSKIICDISQGNKIHRIWRKTSQFDHSIIFNTFISNRDHIHGECVNIWWICEWAKKWSALIVCVIFFFALSVPYCPCHIWNALKFTHWIECVSYPRLLSNCTQSTSTLI